MDLASKYKREQIIQLLIDLESGKLNEDEVRLRKGLSAEQLAEWRREYPIYRSMSAYNSNSRWVDLALAAGLLSMLAAYFLQDMNQSMREQLGLPLIVVFCASVLFFIFDSAKCGIVRWGRRGRIHRAQRPFAFWTIIAMQTVLALSLLIVVTTNAIIN